MVCIIREKFTCSVCKEEKDEHRIAGSKNICHECERKDVERKEREYFEALDKLTTEERIRKIEQWIYNYKPSSMDYFDKAVY